MHKPFAYLALFSSACTTSCSAPEGDDTAGAVSQDLIGVHSASLTGIALRGTTPSGSMLDGATLAGVSTMGRTQAGAVLTAGAAAAPPLTGAGVVGSTWTAMASTGAQVTLRIDAAQPGTAPSSEQWLYSVVYQSSSGWTPLCGLDDAGQPLQALPVAGVWSAIVGDSARYAASTSRFTFACRGKTIAKCVELGYKPYQGHGPQLASCVRMLRGDYCGTGVGHTAEGATLSFYDNAGVHADRSSRRVEAEWTPSGARCVHSDNSARYELARSRDPNCVKRLNTTSCGASFANGAVLISELPPN
jgi:hypothetical protein